MPLRTLRIASRSVLALCVFLRFFLFVQSDDADDRGGNHQKIVDGAADGSRQSVVDHPHGHGDQAAHADHVGTVDAVRNGGDHLGEDHQKADGSLPGQNTDGNEENTEKDLQIGGFSAAFVAEIVNGIAHARHQIGGSARKGTKQQQLHAKEALRRYRHHNDAFIGFSLHAQHLQKQGDEAETLYEKDVL